MSNDSLFSLIIYNLKKNRYSVNYYLQPMDDNIALKPHAIKGLTINDLKPWLSCNP